MCYLMECYIKYPIFAYFSVKMCYYLFFFKSLFFWPCEVLQLVFKEWFTTNHMVLLKFVANESKVHVSIAKV